VRATQSHIPTSSKELPAVKLLDDQLSPASAPALADPGPGAALSAPAPSDRGTAESLAERLAGILASVAQRDDVPPDAHFFTDLGADSMVMAKFCARVRKQADLPPVSMKEVYGNPTINALAAAIGGPPLEQAEPSPVLLSVPDEPAPADARTWEHVLCGALQFLVYVSYSTVMAVLAVVGYTWIFPEAGPGSMHWVDLGMSFLEIYLRSVVFAASTFVVLSLLPVAAKWLIIGRWRPHEIRIWSLGYVRFWTVRFLVRISPLALVSGSPLTVLYLRMMGAKVGRNVTILTTRLPVCTDLLTIGEGTVVNKDVIASGYRAHGGVIQVGGVTLGRDVSIGEGCVLDINTSMGDGSQMGHRSSLLTGQAVPAGESWHGSPAVRCDVDYRAVAPAPYRPWRRAAFAAWELSGLLGLRVQVSLVIAFVVLSVPRVASLLESEPFAFSSWTFYADAVAFAGLAVLGGLVVALGLATTVPRLLQRLVVPGQVYPLYGVHYMAHRTIGRMTNRVSLTWLAGDSSLVVGYVRAIGYRMTQVQQTGSNFGSAFKHDNPFLSGVGTGTMIADGVSFMNADYSANTFQVRRADIGRHSFLGNFVLYPADAKVGDNCLLATKVMVPIDGPVRHGVGLLGSPPFEIPRSVLRDHLPDQEMTHAEFASRLAAKDRHNIHTLVLGLSARWFTATLAMLVTLVALELSDTLGFLALTLAFLVSFMIGVFVPALVERSTTGFRPQQPLFCSIYDVRFWKHERFWKLVAGGRMMSVLDGTPFKPLVWRLLGADVGKRVFDDGCGIPERTLVTIGSRCSLNAGSMIQCHSQEDGAFKSDRITIGDDCTVGVGAVVHYGATLEDGAVVAADSFVMKGEVITRGALWGGNPAREVRTPSPSPSPVERTSR
jgi:non-ribosomal peptide synthetase-like protein